MEVDGFPHRLRQAVFRLRQEQHVGHHAGQAFQFLRIVRQHFPVVVGAARTRQAHLGLGHQVAQRRAQFVGEVAGKFAQAPERIFQPRQHVVERGCQLRHLHRQVARGEPAVEPGSGDAFGLPTQAAQRREPAASGDPSEQPRGEHRDRHERPQRAPQRLHVMVVVGGIDADGYPERAAVCQCAGQFTRQSAERAAFMRPLHRERPGATVRVRSGSVAARGRRCLMWRGPGCRRWPGLWQRAGCRRGEP